MPVYYYGPEEFTKELFTSKLIDSPPPVIGIDVETISLDERAPIGFSIATSPTEGFYFSILPEWTPEIELIRPLLNNPNIKKVMHNAPFDLRAMDLLFIIDRTNIADTNVMARLLGRTETKLAWLAPEVNMNATEAKSMLGAGQNMLSLPTGAVASKCCNDSGVALALYHRYLPQIDHAYFAVEMEVIPILIDMSLRGLRVNQHDRAELEEKLTGEVAYYRKLCEDEGFNPNSPQQVGYILAKRGSFLPLTRKKTQLKSDKDTLQFLDDPIASAVLEFRHINTFLTRYIQPLAGESRIYTEYNLDAVVGRVSSSKRNMQNIPGPNIARNEPGARYIFMPDSGIFTTGDYSQEHLYILMHKSGDRMMQRVYQEGYYDGDLHSFTAHELHIPRPLAKTINFAIVYGATARTIATEIKTRDIRRCSIFLDRWFSTVRDAAEWIRAVQADGLRTGWAAPTLFGRRIKLPDEDMEGQKRKAVNYPILGSDGEIMKRALILCRSYNLPLVVTVHDSITCDGDIVFPIEELETIPPVRIPFEVKQTLRWE